MKSSMKISGFILILLLSGCVQASIYPGTTIDLTDDIHVTIYAQVSPDIDLSTGLSTYVNERIEAVDPVDGSVLGRLNDSEVGEIIPMVDVGSTLSDLFTYSGNCFGAFDPTLQILWDVYDFENGGRYVSDFELDGALQFVDHANVEIDGDGILRRGENVRVGLGPVLDGAVIDWLVEYIRDQTDEAFGVDTGNFRYLGGDFQGEEFDGLTIYEFQYPLERIQPDAFQQPLGNLRLEPGDYLAALDDDEKFFFARGEQYHMVIDPIMGRPVRNIHAAVVVSDESCLQAEVYACAVMVMGEDRGMEFLDETGGVEGIIYTVDGEVLVSGGLEDRFWR